MRTVARCESMVVRGALHSAGFRAIERAHEQGSISYDARAASECFQDVVNCSLATVAPNVACSRVFVGSAALGQACELDEECAGNAQCNSTVDSCPGTCVATAGLGEPCSRSADCDQREQTLVCNTSTATGSCSAVATAVEVGSGETCGLDEAQQMRVCPAGTWCGPDDAAAPTCIPPMPLDGACVDSDDVCEGVAFCLTDGNTGQCQEITLTTTEGGPCGPESGLSTVMCDPLASLFCRDGVCVATDGSEGSPCVVSDTYGALCHLDHYCSGDVAPSRCMPLKEAGTACSDSDECFGGCDAATGLCTDQFCGY